MYSKISPEYITEDIVYSCQHTGDQNLANQMQQKLITPILSCLIWH